MSTSITFQCASCDADFEVGITQLLERPTIIKCTNCASKPGANRAHAFAQALDDLLASMAALRAKVQFELNLDSDLLPPPYGPSDDEEAGAGVGLAAPSTGDDDADDDDDDDFEDDEDDEDFDDDEFEFPDDDEEEDDLDQGAEDEDDGF